MSGLDSADWIDDWLLIQDRKMMETSLDAELAQMLTQEVLSIYQLLHRHRLPLREMEWKFLKKRLVIVAKGNCLLVLLLPSCCDHSLNEIADMECVQDYQRASSSA